MIVKRSIVIASVGQRTAQSPQRMHLSSSLTIAERGRPFPSARSVEERPLLLGKLQLLEGDDGEAVLGADVDAAAAEDALLRVVDRLDVADEAAGALEARVGLVVAVLDLGDPGPPPDVDRRRGDAVVELEARGHPVGRGEELLDLEVRLELEAGRGPAGGEVLVDRASRLLAVRDRLDQVPRPEGDVAAGVDAGCGRREGRRVDPNRPARRQVDAVLGFQEGEVGLLTDGEDAGVGRERRDVGVVVARGEAAVLVEDGEDLSQLDGLETRGPEEAIRAPARNENDPFPLRLLELLVPLHRPEDGHLVEVLEGDDRHVGRASAQGRARRVERFLRAGIGRPRVPGEGIELLFLEDAERGAGGVEGDEAAPDDDDPPPEVHPVAAVDVQEVVDRLHDAVQLDARDVQVAPLRNADREEEGVEAGAAKLGETVGGGEGRSEAKRDAEGEDPVDLRLDERAGKAVLGDPEPHHPARLAPRLEDGHVVAEEGEVVRRGEAGRSRADHGHAHLRRVCRGPGRGRPGGGRRSGSLRRRALRRAGPASVAGSTRRRTAR